MAANTLAQAPADTGPKAAERATVLGFVTDADSELALREGMAELVPSIQIKRASIRQATAMLRKLPSPEVLVVDITGEDAPLEALRRSLANLMVFWSRRRVDWRPSSGKGGEE